MRTAEEIEKQVLGLQKMKSTLPKVNFFGDDNWEKIDAQVAVLKGEKTADEFIEEDSDEENEVYADALQAEEWLHGETDNDLFEFYD
jgi:hypothetical protein